MSFNFTVQLDDPDNIGGSADAALVNDLQQALGIWAQYISGAGTLSVELNLMTTAEARAGGGPTSEVYAGTNAQGLDVYESSSQYELTTGQHVSGTTSDITISIDPSYLHNLDTAPGLTYNSKVPSNEYNPIDIFLHEIMHGLGQDGYLSQTGTLPGNYETTFDTFIQQTPTDGAFFTGPNAETAYGGPVPLTTTSTSGENYYHFGNTQSDISRTAATAQDPLTLDLMNGIVFYFDHQYPISNLDLAVLLDLGYDITGYTLAEIFTAGAIGGQQSFLGNGNHDVVDFSQPPTGYAVTGSAAGITIAGAGLPTYQAANVEFLEFTGKTIFVESGAAASVALLYSAALDRPPDPVGLTYWENIYTADVSAAAKTAGSTVSLGQTAVPGLPSIADGFIRSVEFQAAYGSLGNDAFVTLLYHNVLDRAPDPSGFVYWQTQFQDGATQAMVLVGFAVSTENTANASYSGSHTAGWLFQV